MKTGFVLLAVLAACGIAAAGEPIPYVIDCPRPLPAL